MPRPPRPPRPTDQVPWGKQHNRAAARPKARQSKTRKNKPQIRSRAAVARSPRFFSAFTVPLPPTPPGGPAEGRHRRTAKSETFSDFELPTPLKRLRAVDQRIGRAPPADAPMTHHRPRRAGRVRSPPATANALNRLDRARAAARAGAAHVSPDVSPHRRRRAPRSMDAPAGSASSARAATAAPKGFRLKAARRDGATIPPGLTGPWGAHRCARRRRAPTHRAGAFDAQTGHAPRPVRPPGAARSETGPCRG
jgi:hypothetical protein